MLPSNSDKNPLISKTNTDYALSYHSMALAPAYIQFIQSLYLRNTIATHYQLPCLQHSQLLLDSIGCPQNQPNDCLSNQLWQNLIAPLIDTKDCSYDSDNHCKNELVRTKSENSSSSDATKTSLDHNLESSEMKKTKLVSFRKYQKNPKTPSIPASDIGAHESSLYGKDAEKRIKKSDQIPRNQLERSVSRFESNRALEPNECAFDLNEEISSDFENFEPEDTLKAIKYEIQSPHIQLKEEALDVVVAKEEPTKNDAEGKTNNQKSNVTHHYEKLKESELDVFETSFSDDDWLSLDDSSDVEILPQ